MGISSQFFQHDQAGSFVNQLRRKRFAHIEARLLQLIQEKGNIKVLDIGGEIGYWKQMGWKHPNCTIYLLNLPDAKKETPEAGFVQIWGNALAIPMQAGDVDLVFSNSVIEHVGSWENQVRFAAEVKRMQCPYIIQTPSFWFPLEPHSLIPFFQFIPHALRAYLIMWFSINYFPKAANYAEALKVSKSTLMLGRKSFHSLFAEASLQTEYLFGLPKSYTVSK